MAKEHGDPLSVSEYLKTFWKLYLCVLIDAVFLILVGLLNYGMDHVLEAFPIKGLHFVVQFIIQAAVAVSTTAPVILMIWRHVSIIYYQSKHAINRAAVSPITGDANEN